MGAWRLPPRTCHLKCKDGDTQAVAGPESQAWKLNDSGLRQTCSTSAFDRIVFIERAAGWYKQLKPENQVVRFG